MHSMHNHLAVDHTPGKDFGASAPAGNRMPGGSCRCAIYYFNIVSVVQNHKWRKTRSGSKIGHHG
jgi:hypothetical protein